jgi:type IV secretory pathway VirD2 relaxase
MLLSKSKGRGKYKPSVRHSYNMGAGRGNYLTDSLNQRVIVKSRYLKMVGAKSKAVSAAHINYITRDSVGIGGEDAVAFNSEGELGKSETKEFLKRGTECPHQFRFIVSPENGGSLNMEGFAKDFIKKLEIDLLTKLDYVGVVHYDTDNPHIHFVVNGKTDKGKDLKIDRDYLSNGMRLAAGMVATNHLGQRNEQDIQNSLDKEIAAERFTLLDKKLLDLAAEPSQNPNVNDLRKIVGVKVIDLSFISKERDYAVMNNRASLLGRLIKLEEMGVAFEKKPGIWVVVDNVKERLQDLSRRNQQIKEVMNHIEANNIDNIMFVDPAKAIEKEILGKVVGKGLVNELYDTKYIVIEGVDGKIYHTQLSLYSEKSEHISKVGNFVKLDNRNSINIGGADYNALDVSKDNGLYSIRKHEVFIDSGKKKVPEGVKDLGGYLKRHQARMESLESKGLITAVGEGRWKIPSDLIEKIKEFNQTRKLYMRVDLESTLSLAEQVKARGLTLLDKQLINNPHINYPNSGDGHSSGFKKEFEDALQARLKMLENLGLAENTKEGITIAPSLAQKLVNMEFAEAGEKLVSQFGKYVQFDSLPPPSPLYPDREYTGELAGFVKVPSGKLAILKKQYEQNFTLVPAKSGMERLVGKEIQITIKKEESIRSLNREMKASRAEFKEIKQQQDMSRGMSL